MSAAATVTRMTAEEMLALPDDGVKRWLIRGELREQPMTYRGRRHCKAQGRITHLLWVWLESQPEPRGEILDGDVGFRIRRDPDTTFGIDVAYIDAALAARTPEGARPVDGAPVLAVEILSPSNTQAGVVEKVTDYLAADVPLVWVVEPVFRTVTVYRPGAEPELFNRRQELVGDPHLPGLRIAVADIFGA